VRSNSPMKVPDLAGSTSSRPTVTVIMANFNGAAHLAETLGSVQKQSMRDLEIIVSDDASDDRSAEIVTALMAKDPRIRLIRGERNGGPAAARNRALAVANGEWIAIVDGDDLIHPKRFATLVEAAVRDGADIVADDLLVFDSDHSRPPTTLLEGRWARAPFWVEIRDYIRLNNFYGRGPALGYLKPLFRSSLLTDTFTRYDEDLRIAEDYNLALQLLRAGARFRVYPLLLYFYRKHSASTSHRLKADVLEALKAADLKLLDQLSNSDRDLAAPIHARIRSIETALAYEELLNSLKIGDWSAAVRGVLVKPQAALLLKLPLGVRLHRLRPMSASGGKSSDKRQVCVLSRQRVVRRTNGSSVYLLDLASAIAKRGFDVHFLSPSPTTLGRWPYLTLSSDLSVFSTFRVRGTWRLGHYLISKDLRRMIQGPLAFLDKLLVNMGFLTKPLFRRAPYSIAEPLTREDQLFLAGHVPKIGDFLIADYCFLTDALPYALRPDARSAVIMHDLFSSRASQFDALGELDSVAALTEVEECEKLAQADCIVAIQREEAEFLRQRLPGHRIIVAPMAAHPLEAAQAGNSDLVLFVGSVAAPNVDGLRWFLETCWPRIRAQRPNTTFCVAGTVVQLLGPAPAGVKFLGLVDNLTALYENAGVVVSPLRVGSGLKIKLIEALGQGKAVVATSATLQGVVGLLADSVRIADDPEGFAAAVNTLLDDEKARKRLGSRGLDALKRNFSPDKCYGALVEEAAKTSHSLSAVRRRKPPTAPTVHAC
jgi:glycosyltransferase involved in cell wall biosynthesis